MSGMRYSTTCQNERLPITIANSCSRKETIGCVFKQLMRKNRKQDEGQFQQDIDRDCEQLCVSSFSDEIEQKEPSSKFNTPKCLEYQGRKDPVM